MMIITNKWPIEQIMTSKHLLASGCWQNLSAWQGSLVIPHLSSPKLSFPWLSHFPGQVASTTPVKVRASFFYLFSFYNKTKLSLPRFTFLLDSLLPFPDRSTIIFKCPYVPLGEIWCFLSHIRSVLLDTRIK